MTALEPTYLEAPAQISGQELRTSYDGLQEGVFAAGDLKVTAGGGVREVIVAAGVGFLQGDAVTDQGLYRARNDANISSTSSAAGHFEAGGIPPADATNPRIDQIVAHVYDASHDGLGQRKWRPEVISGVATGGATLDNRAGAAALPGGAVRLADVLVPAGATTISAGNIRDRRPWARGAHRLISRNAGDYSTASGSFVAIDPTNLAPRLECSGGVVVVTLAPGYVSLPSGELSLFVDGSELSPAQRKLGTGPGINFPGAAFVWQFAPAAGSHVFTPHFNSLSGTSFIGASTSRALTMQVEEIVKQNASND